MYKMSVITLEDKIQRTKSLPHTTKPKSRQEVVERTFKSSSNLNENNKGDVEIIEEDEIEPIPIMPNPSPIMFSSPTVSPLLKDCTVYILYTQEKVFEHDKMQNHVGDEELKSIGGDGIGGLKEKEIKNDKKIWRRDKGTSSSFDLLVRKFFNELEFVIDLDFIQWNIKILVEQTLLQVRNVKCTINSAQLLREFKTIGYSSYFGNDLERSDVSRIQLSPFAKTYHPFP
ncbi:hypothetical protein Tco_0294280 [Tanacetum coccineum]